MTTQTFSYTGGSQTWTVPTAVELVDVDMAGGQGGGAGGQGGRAQVQIGTTPGDVLTIDVGGQPSAANGSYGGISGGNGGGSTVASGFGGGGASTLLAPGYAVNTYAAVAGGGGGAGGAGSGDPTTTTGGGGGAGGGGNGTGGSLGQTFTGDEPGSGGLAGTTSTGGAGGAGGGAGAAGSAGSTSSGGAGGAGAGVSGSLGGGSGGGGGGGGFYGGGGGGGGNNQSAGGGGGGGASYADPNAVGVAFTEGFQAGNGYCTLTWYPPASPVLEAPPPGGYVDDNGTDLGPFSWQDQNVPGQTTTAWSMRLKPSGASAYSYWNASSGTWQSTQVWNAGASPSGLMVANTVIGGSSGDGQTANWSIATQSQGGQGPFAPDASFTPDPAGSVTVVAPSGPIQTTAPLVGWKLDLPAGQQVSYKLIVYTLAMAQTPGFTPEYGAPTQVPPGGATYNGVLLGPGQSATAPTLPPVFATGWVTLEGVDSVQVVLPFSLQQGSYVIAVGVTTTSGVVVWGQSPTFTVGVQPPAVPSVEAVAAKDPATGAPMVTLTVQGHDNVLSVAQSLFSGGQLEWSAVSNANLVIENGAGYIGGEVLAVAVNASGTTSVRSN